MSEPAGHRLREWVRYLGEIGVRELYVSTPAPRRSAGETTAPPPDETARPPVGSGLSRPTPPARRTGDLFRVSHDREEGFDPARQLRELRNKLGDCTRCGLHAARTNIVFGVGDPRADLMFIGEGPGADEDAQGEPFVGRAGQKLNEMIGAIGLRREDVYIANVVKCRPPNNREPNPEEVVTCAPFLFGQIEAIRPKVIVTLGAPATRTLLGTKIGITKLRGTWHSYHGIPVMPTFHPAYLLRAYTPENRRNVWNDLKAARARIDGE